MWCKVILAIIGTCPPVLTTPNKLLATTPARTNMIQLMMNRRRVMVRTRLGLLRGRRLPLTPPRPPSTRCRRLRRRCPTTPAAPRHPRRRWRSCSPASDSRAPIPSRRRRRRPSGPIGHLPISATTAVGRPSPTSSRLSPAASRSRPPRVPGCPALVRPGQRPHAFRRESRTWTVILVRRGLYCVSRCPIPFGNCASKLLN